MSVVVELPLPVFGWLCQCTTASVIMSDSFDTWYVPDVLRSLNTSCVYDTSFCRFFFKLALLFQLLSCVCFPSFLRGWQLPLAGNLRVTRVSGMIGNTSLASNFFAVRMSSKYRTSSH